MIADYVRYGTLQSQIVRTKCGNIGSIEKCFLLCIGDKNREHLADIANPAMVESATNPTALFALPTAGVHTAQENGTAIPIKSPCKYFAGFFIADSARIAIFSAAVLRGKNRSKSCFIPKYPPKKFPNRESAGQIRPNAFKFPQSPAIFRNFPPPKLYFKHYSPAFARRGFHKKPLGTVRAQAAACARTIRKSRSLPRRARAREKRDGRNR